MEGRVNFILEIFREYQLTIEKNFRQTCLKWGNFREKVKTVDNGDFQGIAVDS